ncbi:hypothetical protein P153DRAFT_387994 [Dothidotthia symphoricarpi CBS 119687]|uniref:Uncharacterized protein n=1 Tax=Dothidotthia symphoricarpi CBS 119687 TaxID=1392245 RepID=A0A6A6A8F3_9PLEO|nr:uncharacterized protein P153DRAFT_387994 [Dothidotthia symphoricarpi CBS 119687]KAF2127453.1 hypothetical protein P153DRAFT_387994 [Dothidotthia symphoricarpi CBS 119687]
MTYSSQHNWRPNQDHRPTNRGSGRPYQNNNKRWPSKNQDDKDHQADDQIAPRHASGSVDDLQRWALTTANFLQHGHGKREDQIIERVQRRYANADIGGYENPHAKEDTAHVQGLGTVPGIDQASTDGGSVSRMDSASMKRRRSTSPAYNSQNKRPRSKSPLHKARMEKTTADWVEEDDDYAQSSEWSFPGSEDEG